MFQQKFTKLTKIIFPMTSYTSFLFLKIKVLPLLTKPQWALKHLEPVCYSNSFINHVLQLNNVTSYLQVSHPHLK